MLACLVISMTATSVLLGWIDPSWSDRGTPAADEIRDLAVQAVASDVDVRTPQWRAVEIVQVAEPAQGRIGLAAITGGDADDWHFRIDSAGRPSRMRRWSTQQASSVSPGAIRIRLEPRPPGAAMDALQRRSIEALVDAIRSATGSKGSLPVRMLSTWPS